MTHTQTPWQTGLDGSVRDAKGNCIPLYSGFIAEAFYGEEPAISNAAFIVTAVNAYDKQRALIETLVKALTPFARVSDMEEHQEAAASVMVNVSRCRDARTAIAAAKEQSK